MSLKNLQQRYNEKVNQLYKGATTKFDNGKPSTGFNDDPLIVRRPGNGYWNFAEGRMLPISSAANDVKRITLFSLSIRGVLFLAKQQLLQTGNTFEHTRIINPFFAVANAVPFFHFKRNLRPLTVGGTLGGLAGRLGLSKDSSGTDVESLRKIAQLQTETYNKLAGTPPSGLTFWQKIPVVSQTISAVSAKRSVGESKPWSESRPELSTYVVQLSNRTGYKFKYGGTVTKETTYGTRGNGSTYFSYYQKIAGSDGTLGISTDYKDAGLVPDLTKFVLDPENNLEVSSPVRTTNLSETATSNVLINPALETQLRTQQSRYFDYGTDSFTTFGNTPYLKYFTGEQGSIRGLPQIEDGKIKSQNAKYQAGGISRIKYIKDPANEAGKGRPSAKILEAYKDLPTVETTTGDKVTPSFDDPIVVSFAMGKDDHVQFRAFIKDLQQSASPEYKTYQYIGRIEKFISYVTVQREVSFKLSVLAFSKDELPIVWKRINYLTGMVYPYGINRGILRPNIIRMTIGRVFVNQPGYITSLSTSFNDITESWDIDDQVPIGATLDMKFSIIEKRTALASTPLYGITQNVGGFSDTLAEEAITDPRR